MGCCANNPINQPNQTIQHKSSEGIANFLNINKTSVRNSSLDDIKRYKQHFLNDTSSFILEIDDPKTEFIGLTGILIADYQEFYEKIFVSSNLIKNPCGLERFDH